ncbi:hypothetical protein DPMN_045148 [Dreissena polymorpha]|uniref:Uncharacterized protein n=1 Tax=Dreissena polymorpha TaxID=45954 RepID=A0A9D4D778_DREPO|nr:hypothetical protein DPMN_045148 [Dreissena polymorpha]
MTRPSFELDRDFIGTKLLTKFHEDRTINVVTFELDRDFIGTKLLTKFHKDRTINVASRVFTNKCGRRTDGQTTDKDRKNAPPTGGHVFQATGTIFELVLNIIGTNLLTKFHDDHKIIRLLEC